MRALVQRVTAASVRSLDVPEGPVTTGRIGHGLVALVGVTHADTSAEATRLADKVGHLRIFDDEDGVMNRSVGDVGGAVLVVSQFTLYADASKGRRPSYVAAAAPEAAEPLVDDFAARLERAGLEVASGRFRTHMQVELTNDGPVTLMVEVRPADTGDAIP